MDNTTEPRFECCHCSLEVTPHEAMGTRHRNHCNHWLWGKHVATAPADRASASRGCMEPIGLTLKREGTDKYGKERLGDVMIVHCCQTCGHININRIAADDPGDLLVGVFTTSTARSSSLTQETLDALAAQHVYLMAENEKPLLDERLFGIS